VDPNNTEQTEQPHTESSPQKPEGAPRRSIWDEALRFVGKYDRLLAHLLTLAALLLTAIGLYVAYDAGRGAGPGASTRPPEVELAPSGPVSVSAQAKSPGVNFWSGSLRILPRHGRIRLRLRVENTGARPLTGLSGGAELAEPLVALHGKCWHRSRPCRGSLLESGVPLPDLQPGEWTAVVFSADVPSDIRGATYTVRLKVSSDQKGEESDTAEIVVSASDAEEEVRPFVAEVEGTLAVGGDFVEVAQRSKRLLLGQWPALTLEHPRSFEQIRQFRSRIGGRPITVDDLNYERWLEGQVVRLRVRVLERPVDDHVDEHVIRQRVELGSPGGVTRLRCYIPRRRDHLLARGDEVEVKAVIVAWGPEGSPYSDLTVAVCPAARVLRRRGPPP
jgi:hypothetical protein